MIRHDSPPHMIVHPPTRWCHPGLVSGLRYPKGEANLGEMHQMRAKGSKTIGESSILRLTNEPSEPSEFDTNDKGQQIPGGLEDVGRGTGPRLLIMGSAFCDLLWMCKHRIKVHQSDTSGGQVARTSKSSLRPLDHCQNCQVLDLSESSQPSTICSKKNRFSSTWCNFIPACSQSLVFHWSLRGTHQPPAQRMEHG